MSDATSPALAVAAADPRRRADARSTERPFASAGGRTPTSEEERRFGFVRRRWHRALHGLCLLLLAGVAAVARADTLDTVLDLALKTIDPSLAEAKGLLKCAIAKGGLTADTLKTCGGSAAQDKADDYLKSDSTAQTIVNVALAASKKQWAKVVEIGGTKLVLDLACTAAMPPGPVKSVLCSSITSEVAKLSKPALGSLISALSSSPPDAFKLVAILGPGVACKVDVIPAALRETTCGVIGEVLAAGKDLVEGITDLPALAVSGLGAVLDAGDKLLGSYHEKQTPKAYFKSYWIYYSHKAAWLQFVKGDQAMQEFVGGLHKKCRDYYGSSKPCDPMRKVFLGMVTPVVAQLQAAGAVHFETELKPHLLYHYLFYRSSNGQYAGFSSGGDGCKLYHKFPLLEGDIQESRPRPTVWDLACAKAKPLLDAELKQHRPTLELQLAKLAQQGCTATSSSHLVCIRYDGQAACLKALPTHAGACFLDANKANAALAEKVVQQLGKRCSSASLSATIVQCTRAWKVEQCKSVSASYYGQQSEPWGGKFSLLCELAPDPSFEAAKLKAIEIAARLNYKPGSAGLLATAADATGADCKPAWDPVTIGCKNHKAIAAQMPNLGVPYCAPDPNKDGADSPCVVPVLTVDSGVPVISHPQPAAAVPAASGGQSGSPPSSTPLPPVGVGSVLAGRGAGGRAASAVDAQHVTRDTGVFPKGDRRAVGARLPAVQAPAQAQLPAVQAPATAQLPAARGPGRSPQTDTPSPARAQSPAVQAPTQATLPAVQLPQRPTAAAPPSAQTQLPAVPTPVRSTPAAATSSPGRAQLPAVQAPAQAQLPAVQAPEQATLPAVQTPQPSPSAAASATPMQLPAVQSPARQMPPASSEPAGHATDLRSAPPNWGAAGGAAGSLRPPSPEQAAATRIPSRSTPALDPATERALAAAACTRTPEAGALRFSCSSRAGLARCETLRQQGKVAQCVLSEPR